MDPVSAGLAILSFGMNAFGQKQQSKANAQAAQYNAAINMQNAELARQQGLAEAENQARDAKRTVGSMVASYGASGVQTDVGSPLDVLADSARMAMLDNLTIKYNAEMKARSYEQQAQLNLMGGGSGTADALGLVGAGLDAFGFYKNLTR